MYVCKVLMKILDKDGSAISLSCKLTKILPVPGELTRNLLTHLTTIYEK